MFTVTRFAVVLGGQVIRGVCPTPLFEETGNDSICCRLPGKALICARPTSMILMVSPPDTLQSANMPIPCAQASYCCGLHRGASANSQIREHDSPLVSSPRTWLFMLMSVENNFLSPGARMWGAIR